MAKLSSDLDLARACFVASLNELAVATTLLAGRLTVEQRGKLLGVLANQADSAAERLMCWCLTHGVLAQRGPMHVYLAFHGDAEVQALCARADGIEPAGISGDLFERSLAATQNALRRYQLELEGGRLRSSVGRNN